MSAASTYLQNLLLDHLLRGEDMPSFAAVYAALHIEDPTSAGLEATEVSGDGYARVNVTGAFAMAVAGIALNNEEIAFPEAASDWGTVKYIGLWDAATEGQMLLAAPIGTYRTVATGDVASFGLSAFEVRVR
jgi:hypothetical protein